MCNERIGFRNQWVFSNQLFIELSAWVKEHMDIRTTGLLSLPFPTGSGKSKTTERLIAFLRDLNCQKTRETQEKQPPIVYVTPQRKNVLKPEDIELHMKEPITKYTVMRLWTDTDVLKHAADGDYGFRLNDVSSWLRKELELDSIITIVKSVKDVKVMYDAVRDKYRKLKRTIKRLLCFDDDGRRRSREEILDIIKTSKDWQWLECFYPTIHVFEAEVILCTAAKLFATVDPLIDHPFSLFEDDFLTNSVVFFDEFDEAKSSCIDSLINLSYSGRIDLTALVRTVDDALSKDTLPTLFKIEENDRLNELKTYFDAARETTHFNFCYKAKKDTLSSAGLFMYDGVKAKSYGNDLWVYTDMDNKLNKVVCELPHKEVVNPKKLGSVVRELRAAVVYFVKTVSSIAEEKTGFWDDWEEELSFPDDLEDFVQPQTKSPDGFDKEIHSIMSAFGITDFDTRNYIIRACHAWNRTQHNHKRSWAEDAVTIFERPVNLVRAEDSLDHRHYTAVSFYEMAYTPEALMKDFISRNLVIALSATDGIESPLSNFSHEYLYACRPECKLSLPEDTIQRLVTAYEEEYCHVDRMKVVFEPVDDIDFEVWLQTRFDKEKVRDVIREKIPRDSWVQSRYMRIVDVYRYFLSNIDSGVFIATTSVKPKNEDSFSVEILDLLFRETRKVLGCKDRPESCQYVTGSENFDKVYRDIVSGIELKTQRIFVCASYMTLATGVNPQHRRPSHMKTVTIGKDGCPLGKDVDIVGVYLDEVTLIAPSAAKIEHKSREEEVLSLLATVFEIREMEWFGDFSRGEVIKQTESLFTNDSGVEVKRRLSVRMAVTRILAQMVGRMDRTKIKAARTFILYKHDLPELMDPYALDNTPILGPTTRRFFEHMKRVCNTPKEDEATRLERVAAGHATDLNYWISKATRQAHWSPSSIEMWNDSNQTLQVPTATSEEIAQMNITDFTFHCKAPTDIVRYRYNHEFDYKNVHVSFDPNCSAEEYPYEVSAEASRLPILRMNDEIRSAAQRAGIPLEWHPKRFILNATGWHNVYLGRLGEFFGATILNNRLDVKCVPIVDPDKFEKFDMVMEGTDIYVDFKHWLGAAHAGDPGWLEKVYKKAEKVGARKILIVNLLANDQFRSSFTEVAPRGDVMVVPYLIHDQGSFVCENFISDIRHWTSK